MKLLDSMKQKKFLKLLERGNNPVLLLSLYEHMSDKTNILTASSNDSEQLGNVLSLVRILI